MMPNNNFIWIEPKDYHSSQNQQSFPKQASIPWYSDEDADQVPGNIITS